MFIACDDTGTFYGIFNADTILLSSLNFHVCTMLMPENTPKQKVYDEQTGDKYVSDSLSLV